MATPLALELMALLEPLARDHGLDLVTVEISGGGRHQTVKVFLDREGGIDIEAVAGSNAWVEEALEGVARLSGPYTLEVSSPGIERVLRTLRHFERFVGQTVTVHTAAALGGASKLGGVLGGVEGDQIVLTVDGEVHRVPFDTIDRARLKADFGAAGEGKRRQP